MIQTILKKYKTARNKIAFMLIVLDTPGDTLYVQLISKKELQFSYY
jgi:hypothetical protein